MSSAGLLQTARNTLSTDEQAAGSVSSQ